MATRQGRPPIRHNGSAAARAEQASRRNVIDAAVASILDQGFYRASTNEIARRAGVTWGVIQHHFGTREALMLAVLEDGGRRFADVVARGVVDGDTAAERLEQLVTVLAEHYGAPEYLAYLQIALNLDHDPATSAEVRSTMQAVARRSTEQLRTLIRTALGPTTGVPDLFGTVFLALRGFLLSQQLVETLAYDMNAPESDRVDRQRRLLVQLLAPAIEQADKAQRD